jgi:Rrf2 family protein
VRSVSTGRFSLGARADYAIRALAALAAAEQPLTADEIAGVAHVPKVFLTVILSELGRADVVRSRRGRRGGYSLSRPPDELAVATVVAALQARDRDPRVDGTDPSQRLRERLADVIESLTLADLIR